MDDPFLPWWLVLLLGMWAVALTLWHSPQVHREIRLWAGLATLVYCVMIFLALGGGQAGAVSPLKAGDLIPFSLMAIGITAAVAVMSRLLFEGRQLAYVLLAVANALLCFYWKQFEAGLGLLAIGTIRSVSLVQIFARQERQSVREHLVQLTTIQPGSSSDDNRGDYLLIGSLTVVVALLLIGTLAYAVRTETARAISSPRHAILPPAELLSEVFAPQPPTQDRPRLSELLVGARADIIVLLTVVVFLHLAMTRMADRPGQNPSPDLSDDDSPAEIPGDIDES
ncbi:MULTISPECIES: hypothetical protein [unclassified Schlesneria]|uniref:hypothetical protein n=1 Tax=Schlesneria TaxID=656899 RepID=UPI00359F6A03